MMRVLPAGGSGLHKSFLSNHLVTAGKKALEGQQTRPRPRVLAAAGGLSLPDGPPGDGRKVRWCAIGAAELALCTVGLVPMLRDGEPGISWQCVEATSAEDCIQLASRREIDIVSLDALLSARAAVVAGMAAVASEDGGDHVSGDYYAVAVVKRSFCEQRQDDGLALADLRRGRSCHGDYNDTAGWLVPLALLSEAGLLPTVSRGAETKDVRSMAGYFSRTCAPNAMGSPLLCSGCEGDCRPAPGGLFSQDDGALECLKGPEGGDVAFVRSTSALKRASQDLQLLCGNRTCADLDQSARCGLAYIPSRAVMLATALQSDAATSARIVDALVALPKHEAFALHFGPGANRKSLLLHRSTTSLKRVAGSTEEYLQDAVRLYAGVARAQGPAGAPVLSPRSFPKAPSRSVALFFLLFTAIAGGIGGTWWALAYLHRRHRHGLNRHAYAYTKEMMDDF